tara:strand:- start:335 stop:658 length:324 start_codon:yes stop_codon:yes gene_type:complete
MEFILKAIISGIIVASVSMMANRSVTIAALLMGIPFTAFLAMIFMWFGGVDNATFSKFSIQTIYFVLTSLSFFVIFGLLVQTYGFWFSASIGAIVTIILYNIILRII